MCKVFWCICIITDHDLHLYVPTLLANPCLVRRLVYVQRSMMLP